MSTMEPIEQMSKMSAQERRAYKRMQEHVTALGDPEDSVGQRAKDLLIRHYGARPMDLLIEACDNPDPKVRYRAAWILGKTNDERALAPLLRLMYDADEAVRYDAAMALGNLKDIRSIDPLIARMCIADPLGNVGDAATSALASIGAAALPALTALADSSDDPSILSYIAGAVRVMREEAAIATLARLLKRPEEGVRIAAIEALGAIGTDRSRAILAGLTSDASEKVRRMAQIYLESTPKDIFGRGA